MTDPVDPTTALSSAEQAPANGEMTCSQCGKEPKEGSKKSTKARRSPPKVAKIECPFCGEMISKRYKKCPACKSILPVPPKKEPAPAIEKKIEELNTELVTQPILEPTVEHPVPIISPSGPVTSREPVGAGHLLEAPIQVTEEAQAPPTAVSAEMPARIESTPAPEIPSERLIQEPRAEPAPVPCEIAGPVVLEPPVVEVQPECYPSTATVADPAVPESLSPEAPMPTAVEENILGECVSAGLLTEQKIVSDTVVSLPLEAAASDELPTAAPLGPCSLAEFSQAFGHRCEAIVLRSSMDTRDRVANLLGVAIAIGQASSAPAGPPQAPLLGALNDSSREMQKPPRATRKRKLKSKAVSPQAS